MAVSGSRARVVHAVRGRLRVRLEDGVSAAPLDSLGVVRVAPGVRTVDVRRAARSVVVAYDHARTSEDGVLAALAKAGFDIVPASAVDRVSTGQADAEAASEAGASPSGSESDTLRELLIGPPPKLDRRFAESLALSAVSLVGARQVGLALGGGMTLPAYFVIWLALRRLTGAGRRR
jgi:hypothetical protein